MYYQCPLQKDGVLLLVVMKGQLNLEDKPILVFNYCALNLTITQVIRVKINIQKKEQAGLLNKTLTYRYDKLTK